jgi:hypothetical protein
MMMRLPLNLTMRILFTYTVTFLLQRDYIFEVINLAIDEIKYQKNKGINNPDNHNLDSKQTFIDRKYVKRSIDIK